MTWTAATNTTIGVTAWSWIDSEGTRTTQIGIGSIYAHLTEAQRRELGVYLLQGTTPPGPPNPPRPENDRPVA